VQGARDWELQNSAQYAAGEMNAAELGMANLQDAMRDSSFLSEFAESLRDVNTLGEVVKMMADPDFQEQAKDAAKQLEASGFPMEVLSLAYYAEMPEEEAGPSQSLASLLLAVNPAGAYQNKHATRHADLSMMAPKRLFTPKKAAAKKAAPKKAAPKKVAKKVAPKRVVKKVAPKRAAPKKVVKKVAPKRAAPKKVVKKVAPKKVAPKKVAPAPRSSASDSTAFADLVALAQTQGPQGYYDPLKLGQQDFWGEGPAATIGFLRHAEIKHGRVAMAGFVGYCIHENGIRWPFALSTQLPDYSSFEGLSAPDVWDATPLASRLQILALVGFFEFWSEWEDALAASGQTHYMRGGKPGFFPAWEGVTAFRNPLLPFKLFDPFGFTNGLTEEEKAAKLNIEVNNGRLAMLGLFSLISEARVPGAVPALKGLIKPYDGEVMGPFVGTDTIAGATFMSENAKVLLPYLN
jgi:hypothetical protein